MLFIIDRNFAEIPLHVEAYDDPGTTLAYWRIQTVQQGGLQRMMLASLCERTLVHRRNLERALWHETLVLETRYAVLLGDLARYSVS